MLGHNNPPIDDMEALRDKLREDAQIDLARAEELLDEAALVPPAIKDTATAERVSDLIKSLNDQAKSLDNTRDGYKRPYLEAGRVVDAFFKKPMEALKDAATDIKKPVAVFLIAQEAEKRKAAEEAAAMLRAQETARLEQAERLLDKGDVEGASALAEVAQTAGKAAEVMDREAVTAKGKASGEKSTASIRRKWVGEMIDKSKLDIVFLSSFIEDEALQKALNKAVASGVRDIAGCKIYEKEEAVIR